MDAKNPFWPEAAHRALMTTKNVMRIGTAMSIDASMNGAVMIGGLEYIYIYIRRSDKYGATGRTGSV